MDTTCSAVCVRLPFCSQWLLFPLTVAESLLRASAGSLDGNQTGSLPLGAPGLAKM